MTRRGVGLVLASVVLASACTVHDTVQPPLTGPSELALSLSISATPDHVTQDGSSTATISVVAKDPNGKPLSNVDVRFDVLVNNVSSQFGMLSSMSAVTNGTGRATVVYTAPASTPAQAGGAPTRVTITAQPVGTNYSLSSVLDRQVDVLVSPPPAPPPVVGAPTAAVTYAPAAPKVGQMIVFNDGGSVAQTGHQIMDWYWDFGDAQPNNEHGPDASHAYLAAGTYTMVYGVTDDLGRMGVVRKQITVTP